MRLFDRDPLSDGSDVHSQGRLVLLPLGVLLQRRESLLGVLQVRLVKAADPIAQFLVVEGRVEGEPGTCRGFTGFLDERVVEGVLKTKIARRHKRKGGGFVKSQYACQERSEIPGLRSNTVLTCSLDWRCPDEMS